MPNETLANSQAVIVEVSGLQTLAVFLLGSLGIALCYFGLPYFEGNSFVQFKLTLLRLITDSLPYGGFLMAGWVLVVKTQGQELNTLGLRCCEASYFALAGFLTVLSIAVPSLLYWIMGIWEAALIYGTSEGTPYWNLPALLAGLLRLASPIAALTEEILFLSILRSYLRRRLNVTISALQA